MSDPLLASYEELPYESFPLRDAQPEVLAIAAMLRGMKPAPVERCRILELGCATGGNLIPIALAWPGSHCVGIDLSPRQIALGQQTVDALAIPNIDLQPLSILDITPAFGQFDYILCHGVFSWVPQAVRNKILAVCRDNLAPQGIAYISFNAYPGWHIRAMFREMIAYHARKLDAPRDKVARSRGFLEQLAQTIDNPQGTYSRLMAQETELLDRASDTYLFHEHLEEFNQPLYFHQFAQLCLDHGLEFLGETRLSNLAAAHHTPKVQQTLSDLAADPVEREQYLDFLINRTFRHSLIVHAGQSLPDHLNLTPIASLWAQSNIFEPEPPGSLSADAPTRVKSRDGGDAIITDPAQKKLLSTLNAAWPVSTAISSLPPDSLSPILQCYMRGLIELRFGPPQYTATISPTPRAYPLARHQASAGLDRVSTLRHRSVTLGGFARLVLAHLDGQHNHSQLAQSVAHRIAAGDFSLSFQGQPVTDPAQLLEGATILLPEALQELAQAALLVA